MAGKQYLQDVLGTFLKNFKFGSLEVDPEKIREDEDIKANMQRLIASCADLLNAIVNSIDSCPQ